MPSFKYKENACHKDQMTISFRKNCIIYESFIVKYVSKETLIFMLKL